MYIFLVRNLHSHNNSHIVGDEPHPIFRRLMYHVFAFFLNGEKYPFSCCKEFCIVLVAISFIDDN